MNLHQSLLTHRYQPPLKIHALFAEKCIYIFFVWSRNVNTIAGSVPLSRSPPTVSGVYSGPRAILHPSFRKICSVISAWSCWQPNQPTNEHGRKTWPPWPTRWRNTAHLPKKRNELIWITRMSDTIGWRWNNWQIFSCYTHRCLEGRTLCKNLFVKCMFRAMRRTCLICNWGVISVVSV